MQNDSADRRVSATENDFEKRSALIDAITKMKFSPTENMLGRLRQAGATLSSIFQRLPQLIPFDEDDIIEYKEESYELTEASVGLVEQVLDRYDRFYNELYSMSAEELHTVLSNLTEASAPQFELIDNQELSRWLDKPYWKQHEAAVLSLGFNPRIMTQKVLVSTPGTEGKSNVMALKRTIQHAIDANELGAAFAPVKFFEWVDRIGQPISDQIRELGSAKGICSRTGILDQVIKKNEEIELLKAELATALSKIKLIEQTTDSTDPKLLTTMRKILLGITLERYSENGRFNISRIVRDLERVPAYAVRHDAINRCIEDAKAALA